MLKELSKKLRSLKFYISLNLLIFYVPLCTTKNDLTVMGRINFQDGIGRIPIAIIDMLKSEISVNYTPHIYQTLDNCPYPKIIKIIINKNNKESANICLFTDILSSLNDTQEIPGSIKIAYTMIESNRIPQSWTNILNNKFDAVVVPDENLVDVYINSGVKKPIFVLPIPLYLEDFLSQKIKKRPQTPFCFGTSGGIGSGKAQSLLVKAFINVFDKNPKVKLKIHARGYWGDEINKVQHLIQKHNAQNIEIIMKSLSQSEYIEFMNSLDCYVLASLGEGFSITPREAMALGIPCILSNVGAQKTICKSNLVLSVNANIPVINPFFMATFNEQCGYQFAYSLNDLEIALKNMYYNYNFYYKKFSNKGREWVKQYLKDNLKKFYMTLIKPQKVILGNKNYLDKKQSILITNNKQLYEKYLSIIKNGV